MPTSAALDPTMRLEVEPAERTGGERNLIEGQIENLVSITERLGARGWTPR